MPTTKKRTKIDWDQIKITVVPEGEPNPGNPYSTLTPEARSNHLRDLYQQICFRLIEKDKKNTA